MHTVMILWTHICLSEWRPGPATLKHTPCPSCQYPNKSQSRTAATICYFVWKKNNCLNHLHKGVYNDKVDYKNYENKFLAWYKTTGPTTKSVWKVWEFRLFLAVRPNLIFNSSPVLNEQRKVQSILLMIKTWIQSTSLELLSPFFSSQLPMEQLSGMKSSG